MTTPVIMIKNKPVTTPLKNMKVNGKDDISYTKSPADRIFKKHWTTDRIGQNAISTSNRQNIQDKQKHKETI